jgi:hypothetical protein
MEAVVNGQSREIGNKRHTRHRTKIIKKQTNTQKIKKTSNTDPTKNTENIRKELADNHRVILI